MASKSMLTLKNCINCRAELIPVTNGVPDMQCDKCKKNEMKYGRKPGVCKYCQLVAAYCDEKCVHCAYAERKNGPPTACAKCSVKAAFPKNHESKVKGTVLCRLCQMTVKKDRDREKEKQRQQGGQSSSAADAAASSSANKPSSSHHHSSSSSSAIHKRRHSGHGKEEHAPKTAKKEHSAEAAENVILIQQLKDQVESLQRQVGMKESQLIEKDRKIAGLSADHASLEKRNREQVARLMKNHKEEIEMLHSQHKQTTRQMQQQLSEMSRASSSATKKVVQSSAPVTSFHQVSNGKPKEPKKIDKGAEKEEKNKENEKEAEKAAKSESPTTPDDVSEKSQEASSSPKVEEKKEEKKSVSP